MALEPGPRRSMSPDSSGRNTPSPRQWRNQLSAGTDWSCIDCDGLQHRLTSSSSDDVLPKDKHYRKYASGVERALALFDTALEEWADYISFLSRLLKVGALSCCFAIANTPPQTHTVGSSRPCKPGKRTLQRYPRKHWSQSVFPSV